MYDAQVYMEMTCLGQDKRLVENKPSGWCLKIMNTSLKFEYLNFGSKHWDLM